MKRIEVDATTNFIKDEVESFYDTEDHIDKGSEEVRIIGFR